MCVWPTLVSTRQTPKLLSPASSRPVASSAQAALDYLAHQEDLLSSESTRGSNARSSEMNTEKWKLYAPHAGLKAGGEKMGAQV